MCCQRMSILCAHRRGPSTRGVLDTVGFGENAMTYAPHQPAPYAPQPTRPRAWWQHPALIITALVILPPVGIPLAWVSRWMRRSKIIATALSGLWLLLLIFAPAPDADQKTAEAKPSPTVTRTATARPSQSPSKTTRPSASVNPVGDSTMPNVVGKSFAEAEKAVELLIDGDLSAGSAYTDVDLPRGYDAWKVCFQGPEAGSKLSPEYATPSVDLVEPGTKCPKDKFTELHPDPTPTYDSDDGSDSGDSTGGGYVYYENCDAVRAAGKAPLHRGEPGYRPGLDRDRDGTACDR